MERSVQQYPVAMVNITNRCTLRCKHCFIFRDGNPNDASSEMETSVMLEKLAELQKRHGIEHMLWMGGEPLLRPDVLKDGIKLFAVMETMWIATCAAHGLFSILPPGLKKWRLRENRSELSNFFLI